MLKSTQKSVISVIRRKIQPQFSYCTSSNDDETKREQRERLLRIRYAQKQLFGRVIRDSRDCKDVDVEPVLEPLSDDTTIGQIKIAHTRSNNEIIEPVSPYDILNDEAKVPDIKLAHPERASEFHWLSQTSRIKVFKTGKSRARNKDSSSTNETQPKRSNNAPPTSSSTGSSTAPSSGSLSSPPPKERTNPNSSEQIDVTKTESNTTTKMSPASAIISAKNLLQQFVMNRRSGQQVIPFDEAGLKSIVSYPLICEKRSPSQLHDLLNDISLRLPSISKVLQATMPESARFALRKWKLGKIEELGIDGFKQYEKETLDRGKTFHSAIENFLSQGEVPASDSPIIKLWQSIDSSLNQLKPKPVLLEQPILHADLKYKGIIDNVSIVENELCAFEWKTSEKSKPRLTSTYDAPVQLCAYLGALNADPRYDLTVKNGCVVVAYKNGDTANVFNLSEADLRKYWLVWLQRLQEYWVRVRDGTLPDPI